MTRPNLSGEPSMEEILASIRKIIAEDPPGSRAAPEAPRQTALRSPTPAAARDPFAAAFAAKPSPSVSSTPADPFAGLGRTNPMSAMTGAQSVPQPRESAPAPAAQPFTARKQPTDIEDQMAEILGIKAKSGVETAAAVPERSTNPSSPSPAPQASVQAALDSLLAPAAEPKIEPKKDARPGFSRARDGFIPGADEGSPAPLTVPETASDPFEFALGRSPFAKKMDEVPSPTASAATVARSVPNLGAVVPGMDIGGPSAVPMDVRPSETPAATPHTISGVEGAAPKAPFGATAEKAIDPQSEKPVVQAAQMAPPAANPAPAPESPKIEAAEPVSLSVPNSAVSATVAPAQAAPVKEDETATAVAAVEGPPPQMVANPVVDASAKEPQPQAVQGLAAPSMPGTLAVEPSGARAPAAAEPVHRTVPIHHALPFETTIPMAESPAPSASAGAIFDRPVEPMSPHPLEDLPSLRSFEQPPMSASRALSRMGAQDVAEIRSDDAMEDSVAELLRPMLRSWLAENMPKIVERALRKELDDSRRGEHKTAAE